jgi:hypothetical protein
MILGTADFINKENLAKLLMLIVVDLSLKRQMLCTDILKKSVKNPDYLFMIRRLIKVFFVI